MHTKPSKSLLLILLIYLIKLDLSSTTTNDPFDFRFISSNGMYMWETAPLVSLVMIITILDRLNQQICSYWPTSVDERHRFNRNTSKDNSQIHAKNIKILIIRCQYYRTEFRENWELNKRKRNFSLNCFVTTCEWIVSFHHLLKHSSPVRMWM